MNVKLKIFIYQAEEGGYWAKVPALPGCVSQGETLAEVKRNIREALAGCLAVAEKLARSGTIRSPEPQPADRRGIRGKGKGLINNQLNKKGRIFRDAMKTAGLTEDDLS